MRTPPPPPPCREVRLPCSALGSVTLQRHASCSRVESNARNTCGAEDRRTVFIELDSCHDSEGLKNQKFRFLFTHPEGQGHGGRIRTRLLGEEPKELQAEGFSTCSPGTSTHCRLWESPLWALRTEGSFAFPATTPTLPPLTLHGGRVQGGVPPSNSTWSGAQSGNPPTTTSLCSLPTPPSPSPTDVSTY